MEKIISRFKEKPKLKITWWAMALGVVNIFIGPILGIFAFLVIPLITKITSENFARITGFVWLFIIFILYVASMLTSIISFKKGERSWAMWLGFIPAILASCFWVLMIVGELFFEH